MLDLKQYDIDALSTIWLVTESNKEIREAVEVELKERIENNKNFSREFLFRISKVLNRALGIFFIPSSKAYEMYGEYVTISLLVDQNELMELATNYVSRPAINTSGNLKAKVLVDDNLTIEQVKLMEDIGFHTKDILKTQYM